MKKKFFTVILFIACSVKLYGWGFWAHEKINNMAVFTLPPEMIKFYKDNIDYITKTATAPDKRRYAVKEEAPRHFLDADHYGASPFDSIPKRWKDAVEKYSEDSLNEYGILPWHVNNMYYQLVEAFKNKEPNRILRLSAEIGHYLADANVPLHATENYNGQLTNQRGIHGFWESRLPELYAENYDFFVGRAQYIDSPLDMIWNTIKLSSSEVDSVLTLEKGLTETFPSDQKYSYENRGANVIKVYSQDYSNAYHNKLNGMVERKMLNSIHLIGSFWFTAWVDAGQPDLNDMKHKDDENEEKEKSLLDKLWQLKKILGREHED